MLRNLFNSLRYYKLSSLLNIIGLSIAFAALIVMMMQVSFEWGYGKSDPNYREIFRVEVPDVFAKGEWNCQVDGNSIEHLTQSEPRVKGCYYGDGIGDVDIFMGEDSLNVVMSKFYENFTNPTQFFKFDIVQGSADGFMQPDKVLIPLSLARQLFDAKSAIGEVLKIKGKYYRKNREQTIIGVYRDFPVNATLRNYIFGGSDVRRTNSKTGMIHDASIVYIRAAAQDTAQIIENLYKYDIAHDEYGLGKDRSRLTAIGEAYYAGDVQLYGDTPTGNRSTTMLLFSISLLVIVIASINFINFSTAMAPLRIRGLNTQLVFGKTKSSLRVMLVAEAVGISLIAYFVALLWVYCFDMSSVSELIRTSSTSISDNLSIVLYTALVAVVVGALAGLYPAFYCTRFSVALVLKGSGMGSARGQWLRSALVGFQYVISITLITVSIFIAVQNSYLRSFPLGFTPDNVFLLDVNTSSQNERDLLVEKLKQNPAVVDVTFSWGVIGEGYGMLSVIDVRNEKVNIGVLPVSYNFLKMFGIPVVEGRDFLRTDIINKFPDQHGFFYDSDPGQSKLIFNRKAQQMYGIKVDSVYGRGLCIGICENINARSLHSEHEPMCFEVSNFLGRAYIKTGGGNVEGLNKFIGECYAQAKLSAEFSCTLLDSVLQMQYTAEQNLSRLINMFTALAILLSLMGVFGLVVFETQYRRREIGLRKIYGSTVGQVLVMLNRKFMIIIAICFVIALPMAWWGVSEWLMSFAFRTPIHWWVFGVALLVVLLITILTVTVQSWRAATENPTKSIKN